MNEFIKLQKPFELWPQFMMGHVYIPKFDVGDDIEWEDDG